MKKDNDQKWLEQLRNRLDGYEEPAGEDLWQRIEADLPRAKMLPLRKKRTFGRAIAAAACVAVVGGAGYVLLRQDVATVVAPTAGDASSPSLAVQKSNVADSNDGSSLQVKSVIASSVQKSVERASSSQHIALNSKKSESVPSIEEQVAAADTAISLPVAATTDTQPANDAAQKQSSEDMAADARKAERYAVIRDASEAASKAVAKSSPRHTEQEPSKNEIDGRWGMSVAMTNGFQSAGNYSEGFTPLPSATRVYGPQMSASANPEAKQFADAYMAVVTNNIDEHAHSEEHFDFPVTYSASFRYKLTDRWGVNAGLSFTQLNTEWRSGTDTHYYKRKQKLYYVGVPVNVSYTFFDSRFISLYAQAGGSIEKCVDGKIRTTMEVEGNSISGAGNASEDEEVHNRPWQYSVDAGLGLQFNITRNYGLFAEPTVAYYIGEDEMRTYRNEHDFSFQLAVGLRVSY